jgi:c-di-GMP-binding flagellar brake protein YcgR
VTKLDRRHNTRHNVSQKTHVGVHYRFIDVEGVASHSHSHAGQALNLSKNGALIRGTIPKQNWIIRLLNAQDILALELELEEDHVIRAVASVQWIRQSNEAEKYEFGLKFERLPDSDAKELYRFLARQERRSGRLHKFPGTL